MLHADLAGGPKTLIETTTEDLSNSAFRCICGCPLALFGRVDVVINLLEDESSDGPGPTSVECDGIVVRREEVADPGGTPAYLAAVFLDHTTVEQRRALDRIVDRDLAAAAAPAPTAA